MIQKSRAFILLPGGMGTVQEALVLLQLKMRGDKLMEGKPIICVNVPMPGGSGFWDPLIEMSRRFKLHELLHVAEGTEGLISAIKDETLPRKKGK